MPMSTARMGRWDTRLSNTGLLSVENFSSTLEWPLLRGMSDNDKSTKN